MYCESMDCVKAPNDTLFKVLSRVKQIKRRAQITKLVQIFSFVLALCFVWLVTHILVNGGWYYYGYNEVTLLACIVLALAVLLCAWWLIKRYEAALEKRARLITITFLAVMAVLQMVLGWQLRYKPVFDIDAIFGGASEWVETGTFASYYDYYYTFPNNYGGLRFMYWILSVAHALGLRDYYFAAMAANCALSILTMYATGQAAKHLLGVRGQIMAYVLFAVSPPFYFIAPAFYTDALSMPFPILTYWFYLLAKKQSRLWKRLSLYALMGVCTSLGAQIKATVVIMLIAILIDGILTLGWKRTTAMGLVATVMLLLGQAGLEHTIYQHLDRAEAQQKSTPLLHWVMMGLTGIGMYNNQDYTFTESFTDREEQSVALKAEIKRRIQDLGPEGLVSLLTTKGNIIFGDGTYGLSDCLGGEPLRETGLREWLLSGGEHNKAYRHICTGILLALYIFMILSGLWDAFSPDDNVFQALVPRLAVFGLMLFLLCWEARWRYFSNYIPLIFLSSLPGIDQLMERLRHVQRKDILLNYRF